MALVPYTITAIERDVADAAASGKQVVVGAVCSLFLQPSDVATQLYDNAAGDNGSTAKVTNSSGQVSVWVEAGDYRVSVNGNDSFISLQTGGETVTASITETQTLASAQTTVTLLSVSTTNTAFYINGPDVDNGRLVLGVDFTLSSTATIELTTAYADGTLITAVQNDGTEALFTAVKVFDNIAEMKADTSLVANDYVICKRYYSGGDLVEGLEFNVAATATVDNFIDHANANGTFSLLINNQALSLKQAGAVGDDSVNDEPSLNAALLRGGNVEGVEGDIYLVSNEVQVTVSGTTFDMKGSTIKAAPSLPSTNNVVKVSGASNIVVKNGKIDGNRANLINTFVTGIYGNGLLIGDGCSNIQIIDIETKECPTNGQLAVSTLGTITDVKFIDYNTHDNNWTGIGGEAQINGNPLRYIQLINGSSFNNSLGGDIRMQGINDFLITGHQGIGGNHGAAVIGVGEAKNVTRGKIVNSLLYNNNVGLPTLDIDGLVGGGGVFAGDLETIEVELDNVTLQGNAGNSGLYTKNGAIITGGTVTVRGHSVSLRTETDSLVAIDNFISQNSLSQALDIDTLVELKNVRLENWGAAASACVLRVNSSGSEISGAFGAITGETGLNGVSQAGSPTDIRLTINSFTGSGTAKGLVAGTIANTWEIVEKGSRNIFEIEDGIAVPLAEIGRAKMYIDVGDGNLKLLKGDGAITVFDPIVTTTAELNDISSAINTDGRKTKGLYVHNDTTNKAVFANSNLVNDVWLDAQGVVTHTPV